MKNIQQTQTTAPLHLRERLCETAADHHDNQPDPLQEEAIHRRLYTDFLALAMYPGMRFGTTAQRGRSDGASAA